MTVRKHIFIVSDGTGETASQMIMAAMVQFTEHSSRYRRFQNVRTAEQIEAVCDEAAEKKALIIFTIVSPDIRARLIQRTIRDSLHCVDLLGPLIAGLATFFEYEPRLVAGLLHNINETYFERIEAMEYTIAHDDGRDVTKLAQADLILLGVSRTSKTPLSIYLSHQGWRVANIPIISDYPIQKEVFEADQRKIVGLTIDPESLAVIRRKRLERLNQRQGGEYADLQKIYTEVEYARSIFNKNKKWPVINVTGKAVEETATEIIKIMTARNLLPRGKIVG